MASRRWDDRWQRYPESVPLPADGGLATSKQRGAMAASWWSRRFVDVLESYGLGTRMQRGRRYARAGQVLSFDVHPGMLVAQVQGSRRTPYVVTVAAAQPTVEQWASVDAVLASRVGFVALACSRARCRAISKTCSATRRSTCSRSPGRRSTRAAVVPIGRTRASTSRPCCTCSPTDSTTTRGCCSPGAGAAATNSSTRCALAARRVRRRAGRRSRRGGRSVTARGCARVCAADRDGAFVEPPDPPDAVLRRLAVLDVDVRGERASRSPVGRVRDRVRCGRRTPTSDRGAGDAESVYFSIYFLVD